MYLSVVVARKWIVLLFALQFASLLDLKGTFAIFKINKKILVMKTTNTVHNY